MADRSSSSSGNSSNRGDGNNANHDSDESNSSRSSSPAVDQNDDQDHQARDLVTFGAILALAQRGQINGGGPACGPATLDRSGPDARPLVADGSTTLAVSQPPTTTNRRDASPVAATTGGGDKLPYIKFLKWLIRNPSPWSMQQYSRAFNAIDCAFGKNAAGRRRAREARESGETERLAWDRMHLEEPEGNGDRPTTTTTTRTAQTAETAEPAETAGAAETAETAAPTQGPRRSSRIRALQAQQQQQQPPQHQQGKADDDDDDDDVADPNYRE